MAAPWASAAEQLAGPVGRCETKKEAEKETDPSLAENCGPIILVY